MRAAARMRENMFPFVRLVVVALALLTSASIVEAQECFLGQVRFFAGPFVPAGHTPADGRLLEIPPPPTGLPNVDESLRRALFSLLETHFGGSTTTFALPDLRGRAPIGVGQGVGLTDRAVGDAGGVETVTLDVAAMPSHSHTAMGTNNAATDPDPEGNVWAGKSRTRLYGTPTALGSMDGNALEPAGANGSVDNMTPFLPLHGGVCTGTNAVFPVRP